MTSVADIFRRNGRLYGARPGVIDRSRRLTWREVDVLSNRIANWLPSRGLVKGAKVAILSENSALLYVFGAALAKAGVVMAPMNYLLRDEECARNLDDLGADALFYGGGYADKAQRIAGGRFALDALFDLRVVEAAAASFPDRDPAVPIAPEDWYSIIYTSGSTGRPKGVIRSHRLSFMNGLVGSMERRFDRNDVSILYTPNFHVSFWDSQASIAVIRGGAIVVMERFDPEEYLHWVETERITSFYGVHTSLKKLIEAPAFGRADLRSIKRLILPFKIAEPQRLRQLSAMFQVDIPYMFSGWGMSETGPLALNVSGDDWIARPGTTGRDVLTVETRIVGADGQTARPGDVGEIEVRAESVFSGYWNRPEETAKAFRNGWFRTGDAAYRDEDNFVYFFSRARDVIKRGGENISAQQVEDQLMESPLIADAAVIGVPDPHWEETVAAFVVAADRALTVDAVIAHARTGLATYKVPQHVFIIDELPKVTVGKVSKYLLRERFAASGPAASPLGYLDRTKGDADAA